MDNEQPKKNARQLADEGDQVAKRYLEWLALEKRKQDILSKLSTTAGVDPKYRDPELLKAEAEYYGSVPDVARRALALPAIAGKAAVAGLTPPDAGGSRGQQVANALKEVVGRPEAAFKENQARGVDLLKNTSLSPENKALAGQLVDMGAEIASPMALSGLTAGIEKAGTNAASLAGKLGSKAAATGRGAADVAGVARTAGAVEGLETLPRAVPMADEIAERAALYQKAGQASEKRALDKLMPEIPEERVLTQIAPEAELAPTATNFDIPVIQEADTILKAGEPMTSDKILKGLSKYGQSNTAKDIDKMLSEKNKNLLDAIRKK